MEVWIENEKIQTLKDILFAEDSAYVDRISSRLEELESAYNDKVQFSTRVEPIILDEIDAFTTRIPKTLGPAITAALENQIAKNQEQIVDALFPIIGKLIKKYIAQEISKLSEQISYNLSLRGKIRALLGDQGEKKNIIDALIPVRIDQVLLIEKKLGVAYR